MRARYYDPALGRFASQDPSLKGVNWFAYCDDNPVNNVDESGKDSHNPFKNMRQDPGPGLAMTFGLLFTLFAICTVMAIAQYKNFNDPFAVILATGLALTSVFLFGLAEGKTAAEAGEDVLKGGIIELTAGVIAGEANFGRVSTTAAGALALPVVLAAGVYSLT